MRESPQTIDSLAADVSGLRSIVLRQGDALANMDERLSASVRYVDRAVGGMLDRAEFGRMRRREIDLKHKIGVRLELTVGRVDALSLDELVDALFVKYEHLRVIDLLPGVLLA